MSPHLWSWLGRTVLSFFLCAQLLLAPALLSAQQNGAKPAAPAAKPAVPGAPKQVGDPSKELVGVIDFEAVGATKIEASAITDRLREELLKTGKFTMVDRSQMNAVLDEQALQQSGCTTQECAVQVGKVLGVRKLVSGKVTKISDQAWLVNATVVDVETSETLRAESIRYRGDYFSMLDEAVTQLAVRLSTPAGQKPDLAGYVAAQQQAQPAAAAPAPAPAAAKPEEEKSSSSKWWWIAGGVAVLGAAAASGGGSSSKKSAAPPTGCTSNCGSVSYSW